MRKGIYTSILREETEGVGTQKTNENEEMR